MLLARDLWNTTLAPLSFLPSLGRKLFSFSKLFILVLLTFSGEGNYVYDFILFIIFLLLFSLIGLLLLFLYFERFWLSWAAIKKAKLNSIKGQLSNAIHA